MMTLSSAGMYEGSLQSAHPVGSCGALAAEAAAAAMMLCY